VYQGVCLFLASLSLPFSRRRTHVSIRGVTASQASGRLIGPATSSLRVQSSRAGGQWVSYKLVTTVLDVDMLLLQIAKRNCHRYIV
jgi:hypothetical protein